MMKFVLKIKNPVEGEKKKKKKKKKKRNSRFPWVVTIDGKVTINGKFCACATGPRSFR